MQGGFAWTTNPLVFEKYSDWIAHPLVLVGAVVVGTLLGQFLIGRAVGRLAAARFMAPNTATRLKVLSKWSLYPISFLLVLQATGAMGQAWAIVSATVAALAVGFFATWSILSNLTAAVILLIFRPFRIGDEVELYEADKVLAQGKVLDLNLVYTTLAWGNTVNRIPNNLFLQRVVRVMREGAAPDPLDDASEPFFRS